MLSVYCPRHRQEVLVSLRRILAIDGEGRDLRVRWICWCGHVGTEHPHRPTLTAAVA